MRWPCFFACCLLLLPGCRTRSVTYVEHGQAVTRTYVLPYVETVSLVGGVAGIEVFRGGRSLGVTPMSYRWSAGQVTVEELGFQRGRVTEEQEVFPIDRLWGDDVDERTRRVGRGGLPASSNLAATVTEPDGLNVAIGEVDRRVERSRPVVWEGGRTYALEVEPLILSWLDSDGRVETLELVPTVEDDAFRGAGVAAHWSDERRRPTELRGERTVGLR